MVRILVMEMIMRTAEKEQKRYPSVDMCAYVFVCVCVCVCV